MRQHAADARRAAKIFHRTASATPAETARVCCCPPWSNWQQLTNFRGHFAPRQELAASAAETRRLFERGKHSRANPRPRCVQQSWKLFMLRTRQTQCKTVLDDKLLTLSRFQHDVEHDDQQIWDVYCESGASELLRIHLKYVHNEIICIRVLFILSSFIF